MSDHWGRIADSLGTRGPSAADDDGSDATTTDPDPTQPTGGGTSTDRARSRSSGRSRTRSRTVSGDTTIGGARSVERAAQIQDIDFTPTRLAGFATVERAAQVQDSDFGESADSLGTIADARIPGTDSTVLDAVDRADQGFRDRVVDPVASGARTAGEMDFVGPGGTVARGSEERGELFEDFTRSAGAAVNVPGFVGGTLRAGPRLAQLQGDPEEARQLAGSGADLGREGAAFARENPFRSGAMAAGALAGAGIATGAVRGGRAGSRRARETDFDFDFSDFTADTRGQVGAGRTRRRSDEDGSGSGSSGSADDTITIGGGDLSSTAAIADPTRGGRFGSRPTAGRHPQDPGRTVDPPSGAGTSISTEGRGLGFRTAATERGTARVPRDPLDTSGGATPTGQSLGGLLGTTDAAAGAFAGLSAGAQLGRQQQAQTPAVTDGFETGFEIGGTGATGTGTDTTPEIGTGTDTDPFTGAAPDDDIASMVGIGGRTQVGTRTGTRAVQRSATQQTPTTRDPTTTGDPTRTGFRTFRTTRTPPRIPTGFPTFGGGDDEFEPGGADADDDFFDTGFLSGAEATEQFDDPDPAGMAGAMNDVFPGAPSAFEGNFDDDPFAFDESEIFGR